MDELTKQQIRDAGRGHLVDGPPQRIEHEPLCNAELPGEPGPMCARPLGHPGPHVSASGLWRWNDK